jgi:Phage terminase large subunit (GpA).
VRAWGPRITSWLVDYGRLETWGEVERILDKPWRTEQGEEILLQLAFLDSGFRTDEVYEFAPLIRESHSRLKDPARRLQGLHFRKARLKNLNGAD